MLRKCNHPIPVDPIACLRFGIGPVFAGAFFAGANGSQEIETEDSGRVTVVKINLECIVAHGVSGLRGEPWFEHRKER